MQAGDRTEGAPIGPQAAQRFAPAERILSAILTRQAERYGERTLFVFGDTRWS